MQAHELPSCTVIFGSANQTATNTLRGWDKCLRDHQHLSAVPLRDWVLVFSPRDYEKAQMFVDEIVQIARPMGIEVARPALVQIPDVRGSGGALFAQTIGKRTRSSALIPL